MKLGVFLASHNQPYFLRATLAQICQQSRHPAVLAIHENGQEQSYRWAVEDIIQDLASWGFTKVIYDHTPYALQHPQFHLQPLRRVFDEGCDLITKVDHDDIMYIDHFNTLIEKWEDGNCDCFVSTVADVLELKPGEPYSRFERAEWTWNPTGGMSDAVIFNRRFASALIDLMRESSSRGVPDDVLIGRVEDSGQFKVVKQALDTPTMCYVAHGQNTSGRIWENPEYLLQKAKRTMENKHGRR